MMNGQKIGRQKVGPLKLFIDSFTSLTLSIIYVYFSDMIEENVTYKRDHYGTTKKQNKLHPFQ